ncbi:MAG: hypothetical protein RIR15_337, partial [Actinomycetota bacterium]
VVEGVIAGEGKPADVVAKRGIKVFCWELQLSVYVVITLRS